tara:strand:+ start:1526 stop:2092 length:567 start_codon:yes stop_codon:yes gene_type:complete
MKYLFFLFITLLTVSNDFYAQNTIKTITEGVLLVRLQTNEHLIKYYTENDMLNKARMEKKKQAKLNKEVMHTFQTTWSLCPVYFFYSNSYHEIKRNDFTNVFNYQNEALSAENLKNLKNNFLIAYIGDTHGALKFNALVLTNQYLKKLPRPYPRYVRTYDGFWFLKRKLRKSIQILEKKINFQLSRIK